jgi:hypothetical protein
MTGMSVADYQAMMLAGGRSPEGWRSVKERAAAGLDPADTSTDDTSTDDTNTDDSNEES